MECGVTDALLTHLSEQNIITQNNTKEALLQTFSNAHLIGILQLMQGAGLILFDDVL